MKKIVKFPLTTEQLELLLAFEQCGSLSKLALLLAKDPSVISRNLQRLGDAATVIIKVDGRWQISPLGREACKKAVAFRDDLSALLQIPHFQPSEVPISLKNAALLVINAQKGLSLEKSLGRSNKDAEENVGKLLAAFRAFSRSPVIHVRHISTARGSRFHVGSMGTEFIDGIGPMGDEIVIDKTKSSGFSDTQLLEILTARSVETVVIAGFTANECIDATARHAGDLGFESIVVGDATATFDMQGPDGKLHLAERVHALTLANLNAHFAKVVSTSDLLKLLTG